jgi:hypothetical protein
MNERLRKTSFVKDYNPHMSLLPNLQLRYDENGIPVSAKCSLCGEKMPKADSAS